MFVNASVYWFYNEILLNWSNFPLTSLKKQIREYSLNFFFKKTASYSLRIIFRAFYHLFLVFPTPKAGKIHRICSSLLNLVVFLCLVPKATYYLLFSNIENVEFGFILSAAIGEICSIRISAIIIKNSLLITVSIR